MRFKEKGPNVRIFEPVTFICPENIIFKGHNVVSEYVHWFGGLGSIIGQFIHIASSVGIGGGGWFVAEDFVNIASGSKIITGTDAIDGSGLIGPAISNKFRNVNRSFVHLKRFSFVATNVTILPGITIGEGAVASAGSVVTKDLEPWTIYAGVPARPVKARGKGSIEQLAKKLYEDTGTHPFILEKLPWH